MLALALEVIGATVVALGVMRIVIHLISEVS